MEWHGAGPQLSCCELSWHCSQSMITNTIWDLPGFPDWPSTMFFPSMILSKNKKKLEKSSQQAE